MLIRRVAPVFVTLLWCAHGVLFAAADAETIKQMEKRWATFEKLEPRRFGSRDLFSFALTATALEWHPERVERALELAKQMQDRDPKSRGYGNLTWYWGDAKVDDLNAVEFCMQHASLIRLYHWDKLSPKARELLEELMKFGVEGVRRRGVKPGYTNIFLMHCWNLVAMGESMGNTELAQEGCRAFDEWLAYTWKNGIAEYVSTTYYGVDAECLALLARHAKNEDVRTKADAALRYLWTDIAANWFEPCQRLGGAHSRDYDYLTGHGMLDRSMRLAGWMPDAPQGVIEDLTKWTPPAEIRAQFAQMLPRTICQRFGARAWETAVHYMGRKFCIGAAGMCKGPEDKAFTINFAGGPKMVMCNFVMDGRGDPYGVNKAVTGGGHMKSHHLTPFLTSVQRGPEVLLLASDNSKTKKSGSVEWALTTLSSHVVFPIEAQVWLGEKAAGTAGQASSGTTGDVALPAEEAIFLRWEDVAAGVRFVVALDTAGKRAPVRWVNDGAKQKAARLTCVHAEKQPEGRGTVAIWARVGEGLDDAGFAQFRRSFAQAAATVTSEGERFDITVAGTQGPLRLLADVAKGERLAREGGEAIADDCLLSVNGKEYGREILRHAVTKRSASPARE